MKCYVKLFFVKIKTRGSGAEQYTVESADIETVERQSSPNVYDRQIIYVGLYENIYNTPSIEEALCLFIFE